MRAAVTEAFGGIDRVVVRDRPKPVPGTGEVRVRVRAASMNPGAGGGIGTFAIQIARARGARVTAVASARNQDLLRELGADACLDYAREDFARREGAFDAILDLVPNRSFPSCRRALAPGGTYVTALPGPGPFLWRVLTALPLFGGRRCRALMLRPTRPDLEELARLAEAGTLRPVVGEVFGLDAIREAHLRMQSGHARGKIVVRP